MPARPDLPLTAEAQAYAWRELARRAGLRVLPNALHGFETLGIDVRYAAPHLDDPPGPALYIRPCAPDAWAEILSARSGDVEWRPVEACLPPEAVSPLAEELPLLFPSQSAPSDRPFAEILPGQRLVFSFDLLAAAVFFLSRWEEQVVPERDSFGRFPGSASTAARLGFLDRPLVDEYALALRAWLEQLLPAFQPHPRRFSVTLSHDIDVLTLPFWKGAKLAASDLVKRRSPGLAFSTLRDLLDPYGVDPYLGGIDTIVELSQEHSLNSVFFFQSARPSRYDDGYDIGSAVARRVLHALETDGFQIGLHPAFAALDQPTEVAAEKARLDAQLSRPSAAVRQHFLRVRLPESWRLFESAGFTVDSSLTFPDQEGFRCGTCYPYPVFDLQAGRPLALQEHPLVVMDATLRQYRALAPEPAVGRILQLARRCQRVGGNFTLLWHNSSFWREWKAWKQVYFTVVPLLREMERAS